MRELEFMPPWYPQLRRRRRLIAIQFWATIALAIGLISWVVIGNRSVYQKQAQSRTLDRQLEQSRTDLRDLNATLAEKQTLETQRQVLAKLGVNVEVSRLLAKLDQIMPKEMSLTLASIDTIEQVKDSDNKPTAKGVADKSQTVSRKLNVKLKGVTPSDADWATLLARLGSIPFFQNVQLVDAQETSEQGHEMREFEVSFSIDLGDGE